MAHLLLVTDYFSCIVYWALVCIFAKFKVLRSLTVNLSMRYTGATRPSYYENISLPGILKVLYYNYISQIDDYFDTNSIHGYLSVK